MKMKLFVLTGCLLLGSLGVGAEEKSAAVAETGAAQEWKNFGAEFTLPRALPLREVLQDPAAHAAKPVRVEGRVADVCRKKGCWMVLTEGERSLRVTMKDYGFFVDTGSSGALADLEGMLVEKEVDPETAAHYAAESSTDGAVPEAGQTKVWEFVATAIRVKR